MTNQLDSMLLPSTPGIPTTAQPRCSDFAGVFRTLARQHAEAGALCQLLACDLSKRYELWPTLRRELLSHEWAEMRVVYPALQRLAETRELASEHDTDAGAMERLITQLDREVNDDHWGTNFQRLARAVETHVRLEEDEIFPQAQRALGGDATAAMDARLIATKQELARDL